MFNLITKWRWAILSLILTVIVTLEFLEARPGESVHVYELTIYVVLILTVGVLLEFLVRIFNKQDQIVKLLNYRHRLSLALTTHAEWNELAAELTKFPSEIVAVDQACLLTTSPLTEEFEPIAFWQAAEDMPRDILLETACLDLFDDHAGKTFWLKQRVPIEKAASGAVREYYCLSIQNEGKLLALLQFKLRLGAELTDWQKNVFMSINDELANVLIASQDRIRLAEMRIAEATLAERRTVTNFLHDNLGQNISYLRLKIDQFSDARDLPSDEMRTEFQRMRVVANASYEIVRGLLETMHSDTNPLLNNLLHEHARQIAQRADLTLTFRSEGRPLAIKADSQRAIFFVFQEIFNNIEKHSRASRVYVFVGWAFDFLTITVSDNGVGFNMKTVDRSKHLGFAIMEERVAALNGQIDFNSTAEEGTTVTLIFQNISNRAEA